MMKQEQQALLLVNAIDVLEHIDTVRPHMLDAELQRQYPCKYAGNEYSDKIWTIINDARPYGVYCSKTVRQILLQQLRSLLS